MNDACIYILTGEIAEGKTTALQRWIGARNDISGVLSPVLEGKRYFLDIATKELFPMEAENNETGALKIGRFSFSGNAFERAIQIIRSSVGKSRWLVLDEVGPLELKGEGFSDVIRDILADQHKEQKLLFVVRNSLRDDMIRYFNIDRSELIIINKASLLEERFA